jgi:hypothetical protein
MPDDYLRSIELLIGSLRLGALDPPAKRDALLNGNRLCLLRPRRRCRSDHRPHRRRRRGDERMIFLAAFVAAFCTGWVIAAVITLWFD